MDTNVLLQICLMVISLATAVVAGVLIPYIKEKTTKEQREHALLLVDIGVYAAEQIFKGPGKGVIKKEAVLEFLKSRNIPFDEADLDLIVEAAVREMNFLYKEMKE